MVGPGPDHGTSSSARALAVIDAGIGDIDIGGVEGAIQGTLVGVEIQLEILGDQPIELFQVPAQVLLLRQVPWQLVEKLRVNFAQLLPLLPPIDQEHSEPQ